MVTLATWQKADQKQCVTSKHAIHEGSHTETVVKQHSVFTPGIHIFFYSTFFRTL